MSIQTQITRLNTAKTNILKSIKNKGVDTSSVGTLSDVPTLIDNIQTGITPTGTLDITANGTHNVTNYANVNVNVASSGGGSLAFISGMYASDGDGSIVINAECGFIEDGATYYIDIILEDESHISEILTCLYNSEITEMYRSMMGIPDIDVYGIVGESISVMIINNVPTERAYKGTLLVPELLVDVTSPPKNIGYEKL